MTKGTLLDDAYRGTHIWIGFDNGKLLASAKGNGTNFKAVFSRYHVDIQGSAPQPIITRINECVTKFRALPIQMGVY